MLYSYSMRGFGFTLIEILVALAIAAILFAIIVSGFSGLRRNSDMSLAVDDSVSFLQDARAKTLSSVNTTAYGVHFETTKFVLFEGSTYNAGSGTNKIRALPSSIEISVVDLNGAVVDVVFKRLTGETSAHGTVTFRQTNDPSITKAIQILSTGLVSVQ